MNLLFVCSRNRLRSPTGEVVFAEYESVQALSAGTAKDAETAVSSDLLQWADVIFAMESVHKRKLTSCFPKDLRDKRIVVLGIPDEYAYMDAELIALLRTKVEACLRIRR